MTAAAIIEEIKSLPPEGLSEVLQFVFELAESRQKRPEELVDIAQRMVDSEDPVQKEQLRSEFKRGFYGT